MNDLRTAIVGTACLVVGAVVTWFIFGSKATHLEQENRALRQQRQNQVTTTEVEAPALRSRLIGQWATTVSKSRLGRIELIFELSDDGSVRWRSVQQQQFTTIAEGNWELEGDSVRFDVTIIDQRSDDVGQKKTALARVIDIGESCLSLEVEGDEWAFHRTTT